MKEERSYICIDMKTFYASVECAERGLNPFETNLVVTDKSRGRNALCLAITPHLKAHGIRNRCRLSEIPKGISYITALPRMQLYIDYTAEIYSIYLDYFSPDDIHVYSIDEMFIDVTDYLFAYKTDSISLARKLICEIAEKMNIPATAGVGTNLYLAKIALDITAKNSKSNIGYLNEELYRKTLWNHQPITDFWQVAGGTARRLEKYGIRTMRGIAEAPSELLYRNFGINAELIIDHAFGRESCLIKDIKNYERKSKSISFSQILPHNYSQGDAILVFREMLLNGCQELMRRKVIAGKISVGIGYSGCAYETTRGGVRLMRAVQTYSIMREPAEKLFRRIAVYNASIRRLEIVFSDILDEKYECYDMLTDIKVEEEEKARERAVLKLKDMYGKNAVLRGTDLLKAATQRERNEMIGGHRA